MRKLPRRTYDPNNRDQVLSALRRQILAAQLKVTLDEQLGRDTSQKVIELSKRELPPLIRVKQDGTVSMAHQRQAEGQTVTAARASDQPAVYGGY